ncbi:MAG: hypothetical protein FJ317_03885 [SAR202 cluster bacterium]|nr:hypothetical protein [SAR202 cluster bacterium]
MDSTLVQIIREMNYQAQEAAAWKSRAESLEAEKRGHECFCRHTKQFKSGADTQTPAATEASP